MDCQIKAAHLSGGGARDSLLDSCGQKPYSPLRIWIRRVPVSVQWVATSEKDMCWKEPSESNRRPNDEEINVKYGKRELRIVTEMNREQLPNFVDALKRPGWME